MFKTFEVVVERDEDGIYVGSVPELPGCHTQGDTLKELQYNIREAIEGYLESIKKEEKKEDWPESKFIKIQRNGKRRIRKTAVIPIL